MLTGSSSQPERVGMLGTKWQRPTKRRVTWSDFHVKSGGAVARPRPALFSPHHLITEVIINSSFLRTQATEQKGREAYPVASVGTAFQRPSRDSPWWYVWPFRKWPSLDSRVSAREKQSISDEWRDGEEWPCSRKAAAWGNNTSCTDSGLPERVLLDLTFLSPSSTVLPAANSCRPNTLCQDPAPTNSYITRHYCAGCQPDTCPSLNLQHALRHSGADLSTVCVRSHHTCGDPRTWTDTPQTASHTSPYLHSRLA